MFGMSNFKSKSNGLESLVRTAMLNGELAPGVAAQVNGYRVGKLTCEEKRFLAILDDAIADGCVVPVELPALQNSRQIAYSVG
jgi:hypothetical protein